VSSVRAATKALPLETCRGPQVVPMRSEIIKNKNVGPPRSPTLAPLVGVGTDFKTTPSWGGSAKDPPGPSAYVARWLK
jgi:hypothetical protein